MAMTGAEKTSNAIAVVSALIAGLALLVAKQADNRSADLERMKVAEQVEIQEAPARIADKHKRPTGAPWRVVENRSSQQIHDVWVQMKDNSYTTLMDVQACSVYAIPAGHYPKTVHFDDGRREWKRDYNGWPTESKDSHPSGKRVISPWADDLEGC